MKITKKRPFELLSKASKKALFKRDFLKVPIEEFSHEIIRTVEGNLKQF